MMRRNVIAAALAAISLVASAGSVAKAAPYTAPTWEVAVRTAPCDAFRRNRDGSWTQTGTIVIADGRHVSVVHGAFADVDWGISADTGSISANSFRNTGESRVLDQRCFRQKVPR